MAQNYTIYAEKGLQFEEKLDEILKSLAPKEFELIKMDLSNDSLISLIDELETLPFIFDLRVVLLEHPNFIFDKSTDERLLESFYKLLSEPVETTVLITLITPEDEYKLKGVDGKIRKSCVNALKDYCNVYKLDALSSNDIDSIIDKNLSGYTISNRAKEELKSRVNLDITRLIVELDKLKMYKYETKVIDEADIVEIVPRDLEDKAYNLSSAIIAKRKKEALLLMSDLKLHGENSQTLVQNILNKLQEMYQTKILMTSGYSQDEIADYYGYKRGRVHYMMQDASKASLQKIKEEMKKLIKIDYDQKRGIRDIDEALELYILSV